MKPYFGLRGTNLNIMISVIAGLDFLYVDTYLYTRIPYLLTPILQAFGYDQYVITNIVA